jgi:hypothetical protein
MAVLTAFASDFDAFITQYTAATNNNKRQAEYLEETLRKLHNSYNQFNLYGRDGNYAVSLVHYQEMLTLLSVDSEDAEWDITTNDLAIFFGVGGGVSVDESFHSVSFANPLILNVTTYKNWKCASITDNTEIQLTNSVNGDSGQIIFKMDAIGGYSVTLDSSIFTLRTGSTGIDVTANVTNIVTWRNDGTDIIYTVDTATSLA